MKKNNNMTAESKKRPSGKTVRKNAGKPKVTKGLSRSINAKGAGTQSQTNAAKKAGIKKQSAKKLPVKKSKATKTT